MTPHNALQPIPVVRDAGPDIVSAVIAALDAHFALANLIPYHPALALLPDSPQFADVRHAVLLWASAHGCRRVDTDDDTVIRITMPNSDDRFCTLHVPDDFVPTANGIDRDARWRPSDAEPIEVQP